MEFNEEPNPLSRELEDSMKTLFTLLSGEKESEERTYCNGTEAIFFDIIEGSIESMIETAKKAGIQLFPIVFQPSVDDPTVVERDYIIMGIFTKTNRVEFRTGIVPEASRFLDCLEKDFHGELIYAAIEAPCDMDITFDIEPEDLENDVVEVYINKTANMAISLN